MTGLGSPPGAATSLAPGIMQVAYSSANANITHNRIPQSSWVFKDFLESCHESLILQIPSRPGEPSLR